MLTIPPRRMDFIISLWRKLQGITASSSGKLDAAELALAAKAVLSLQRGLTGDRRLVSERYMSEQVFLPAYLSYYWPVSYAQANRALHQVGRSCFPRHSINILDAGAGPAPMSCAALDFFIDSEGLSSSLPVSINLTLLDKSEEALRIGDEILRDTGNKATVSVTKVVGDLERDPLPSGTFDLIIFGHCLNEIAHGRTDRLETRMKILHEAASRLSPDGIILMIEPALLLTSRDAISIRDTMAALGFFVLGPCLTNSACPALALGPSTTCHDESAWDVPDSVRKIAELAGLDRDIIKMAWFAFSRHKAALKEQDAYRVVSEAMLNKGGRVRFIICGEKGRFAFSAKKDDTLAKTGGFFNLKRGLVFKVSNPEIRDSGFGWQESTHIEFIEKS